MKFLMQKISINCSFSDAKKRIKFLHFRKLFLILFISFIVHGLSAQTPYFEMDSLDSLYRIENQQFGESIVIALNYRSYPFLLQCCHGTPYGAYRYELQDAGGGYYYLYNANSGHYLSMPDNNDGSRITSSAGASGNLKKWKFNLVNPKGLYTIKNKASGLYLSADYPGPPSWNPYLTRFTEGNVVQKPYVAGDKHFLWAIEPERGDAINCIGMSQIGWAPSAQKVAVLNRTSPLGSEPAFTVTKNGANVLSGTAVVYKDKNGATERYKLYYYAMNLTELTTPGEYELSVAGLTQKFVVNNDAYWKIRHRYGLNTTRFPELFDPNYGFITHWARLANWYTDYRVLEHTQPNVNPTWHYPYWQKITVVDHDPGHNTYADIQPQKHLDNFAMGKGWNHTDQQWCFFAPTATTLIALTELWHYNPDSSATQPILDEILYGVNSLLDVQHPAGNFPQNTFGDNAYTGTVAACGHALAAAYEPLNSFNSAKAQDALNAAKKAWDWVEAHNSVSDWVPYDTQFYRYAFAQERMQLNVELYLITGEQKYKTIADSMISNSKFDGSGRWVSTTGTRFPGEEYYPTSSAVWGLFRYYPSASASMKTKIRKQFEDYYTRWSYGATIDGPYNEGMIHTFGDSYHYAMKAVVFFKMYELFGDKYGEAFNFAEKNTDWLFGYNHFGTSLVFGFGDIFASHGYGSGYNYGRVVPGIILEGAAYPDKITASNHSYNVGESGAVSQVLMMLALSLRERMKSSTPRTVEMYPNTNNGGYPYKFSAGKWRGFQIRREGMHLSDIESIKIPPGFTVYAYEDENLSSNKTTYTSSNPDLGAKKNKIKSFEIISDDVNNHEPEITSISPADQSSFAAGATINFSVQATDAEDGTIDDSRVTWYSASDGFLGTGKNLSKTLSTATHFITVCVKDKNLATATKSITIFVGGFNSKPVAVDDSYSTVQDTALNIAAPGVLGNDSDVDNDPLTAIKKSNPSHGSLTLNSDGSFSYTPNSGFVGQDTFTYAANDGTEDSSNATVTINVASSSAEIPLQVPGCALWLDGSDVNGTGTSPAPGVISTWHDKSGNSKDASGSASLVNNSFNNLPALHFDGQNNNFTFSQLSDIRTVFWVLKEQNQTSGGSPNLHFLLGDSTEYDFHRGDSSLWNSTYTSSFIQNGSTRVDRTSFNGITNNIPENQLVLISLKTTGNVKAENITSDRGFGRYWDGDIAEIIIYNQSLDAANITKVEDYLYNKWFSSTPQTHSVSGTISGDVKQGVSVAVDANHSATTDANGNYTISGLNDGSYTVTPTLAGYTFNPANKNITISGGDKTGVNFTSSVVTYSLTVNNGTGSGSYAENASATISATVPSGQIFDAWTGDTQYIADTSAASTTVTMPGQNVTVTATFKQAPPSTHSISGTISGDIQSGVAVAVDATHSATTDANGNYTISGLSDGAYTVTPTLAGYTFNPANKNITLSGADKTGVDFTSSAVTYSLTVNHGTGSGSYAENASATISATVPAGQVFDAWTGDTQYIADTSAASTTVTMPAQNITVTATFKQAPPNTHSISGTVSGDVKSGVSVAVDATHSATTDANGNYTIGGLADGSYTVTPTLSGYTFTPATANATVSGADVTGIDFTAASTGGTTYSISGTVSGDVQQGVTITATDMNNSSISFTAVTDASGNYTVQNVPDGSGYTVIASLAGYSFNPPDHSVPVNGQDATGYNFTATSTGGGGITDPTDIAGCNLWLDGADPKGDGSSVTGTLDAWKNKADTSNFAYQVDGTKQPEVVANALNGHSLLRFVGGDQFYPIVDSSLGGTSITNISTVFWVIKESSTLAADTCPFFLGNSGISVFHRGIGDASAGYAFDGKYWDDDYASDEVKNGQTYLDGTPVDGVNDVFPAGGYHIVSLVLAGPVEVDSITQDRNGVYGIRSWQGDIAEIITYDSALSGADRQSVEAYLNAKWFGNTPATYSISGTITGDVQAGVTVSAGGKSGVSNANGNYTITGLTDGSYTVTPSRNGYTFAPATQSVTISGADVVGIDFTATSTGGGGGITDPTDITGCNLWLDGADPKGDGSSVTGTLDAWKNKADTSNFAYQVDGTKQPEVVANALNGHSLLRFVGGDQFYPIVDSSLGGTSITNISTVFWVIKESSTLAADTCPFFLGNSGTAVFHRGIGDANAGYAFDGKYWDDDYASDEVKNGQTYLDGAPVNGINDVFPAGGYHIVSLVLAGPVEVDSITQDRNGVYGIRSWQGDIAEIITYDSALSDADRQSVEDYLNAKWFGNAPATYTISGTITGDVQAGVTVSAGGKSAVSNANGNYTITGLADGTYTVTPSRNGYTFAPATQSVTISGADVAGIDFTSTSTGGGGGITDPTDIAGCNLWLDGADPKGDGSSLTGALDAWINKADASNFAYQVDGTKQPEVIANALNGFSLLRFAGGDQFYPIVDSTLGGTSVTNISTIFWVIKEDSTLAADTCPFFLGNSGASVFHRGIGDANAGYAFDGKYWDNDYAADEVKNGQTYLDGAPVDGVNDVFPAGDYHIVSLVLAGPVEVDSITQDRNGVYGIRSWQGDIAEIITYDSALSDSDRQSVEDYLNVKWFGNAPVTYTISGTITGDVQAGVTITAGGKTAISAADGTYTISRLTDGSYTVTPTLAGYTFTPATASATVAGADVAGIDFVSAQNSAPQFTLTVNDGTGSGSYAENTSVNISATVPAGKVFKAWTGDTQYIADTNVASTTVTMPAQDITVTATFDDAPAGTYSISGTVSGDVQQGVTVAVDPTHSATTDASGNYTISGLSDGSYTVTPTLTGYTFNPATANATVAGADVTGIDFTSTSTAPQQYTLTVNAGTGGGQYAENTSVNISATVPAGKVFKAWTGDTQYIADTNVASTTVTMPAKDITVTATFDDAPAGTYSISGTVSGDVQQGVTVAVDPTHSATTDASGNYTISGLSDGSYTVTPTLTGYTFTPATANATVAGADVTGIDFTSTSTAPQQYTLTVNAGTGGGQYAENTSVNISATVPAGKVFKAWTGDTQYIADTNVASTTVTMPAKDITVTATFDDAPAGTYSISGTVSGDVQQGVTITATDMNNSSVSFTGISDASGNYTINNVPDGGYTVIASLTGYTFYPGDHSVPVRGQDATGYDFTATVAGGQYTLTVNAGTGGGQYAENDTVSITATVPAGQIFDAWTGDTSYIADTTAAVTTVTMPAKNVTVTATFKAPQQYTLTVNAGTGGGQYVENDSVTISATVPAGKVFKAWTGDTQYIANVNVASTTVTMPAKNITVTATFDDAPAGTYSISGTVSGDAQQGVTVAVDSTHSATTDASGNYIISGLSDGSYTVTPTLAGYAFTPATASATVAGADVTGIDFVSTSTGGGNGHTVTGTITNADGTGIAGVTVTVGTHTAVTDANGAYTITNVADGSYTVTPTHPDYTFTPATVSVVVNGSDVTVPTTIVGTPDGTPTDNNPPVAANDSYFVQAGETLTVPPFSGVLSNDVDIDGDKLTANIITSISGLSFQDDGGFTYTPSSNSGVFSFTYVANDKKDDSNLATVNITIIPPGSNVPPTAIGDKYNVAQDSKKVVGVDDGVLANDMNASGKTVTVLADPKNGSLILHPDGSFEYTPKDNYSGVDSFSYSIDGTTPQSSALVALNIAPVKVSLGSMLSYKASDISELDGDVFAKAPKLYGVFENGKKGSFKKIKSSTGSEFSGAWGKKFTLYNKKAVKAGYKSYYDSNGPDVPAVITVYAKGKTAAKVKINGEVQKIQLVPPVITDIQDGNGNSITEASAGDTIVIIGMYFGDKTPKVALEVAGKLAKCKVDKSGLLKANYKGKPSAMDPLTGESSLTVILPSKNLSAGTYPIVLDNKIGIATTPGEKASLPEINIK